MSKIIKSKELSQGNVDIAQDINLINKFTKTPLSPDEIYAFSIILCDNEIDRDYEAFTEKALKALAKEFIGKPGILNHRADVAGQNSRIYKTQFEDGEGMTTLGAQKKQLRAWAYMLKSDKNADFIADIEAGIKKEVSVGFSSAVPKCSICGEELLWWRSSEHKAGKTYDGKLCYGIIDEIKDAYEYSFVPIPAQAGAGVTKAYHEDDMNEAIDIVCSGILKNHSRLQDIVKAVNEAVSTDSERTKIIEENKKYLKEKD